METGQRKLNPVELEKVTGGVLPVVPDDDDKDDSGGGATGGW